MNNGIKEAKTVDDHDNGARKRFVISLIIFSIFVQGVALMLLFNGYIDVIAYGLSALFGEFMALLFSTFIHALTW